MKKKKTILVSGGNGSFPKEVYKIADKSRYNVILLSRQEMDVSNRSQVINAINKLSPDYFLHSGALTRPMDIHEKYPEKSILNNIIGTSNVTIECMKRNIKLIYISTDHVYEGKIGNYSESDPVMPINSYAWSKLGGECSVQLYKNSCILRLAMVKYPFPHEYAISDSYKSSIFIRDAAEISLKFIDKTGTYNIGGDRMSIYSFAKKSNPDIKKILLKDIKGVKMPHDVSMNLYKMKKVLKND
jgi:dTDP-4-dehydrorhamnose reductase|tara:strand:+ start:24088 stop:24816 length:729 start_codon:yes stop_codon:yes gene_type:complete